MEKSALLLTLRAKAEEVGIAEVCKRSGLTQGSVYRVLRQSGNPRLNTLARICDALGVDLLINMHEQEPMSELAEPV